MTDIDPHDHGEDAARDEYRFAKLHEYDDFDPRDLPCDILRLLDEAFTIGDTLYGTDWTVRGEAYEVFAEKINYVQRKICEEMDMHEIGVEGMLNKWSVDSFVRFTIFSNKANGNVQPTPTACFSVATAP